MFVLQLNPVSICWEPTVVVRATKVGCQDEQDTRILKKWIICLGTDVHLGITEGTSQPQSFDFVCLVAQSHLTLCDPMDSSPPGFSVHGIFQARILEWVSISYSSGSSWPRDQTHVSCVSCIADRFFTCWATRCSLQWIAKILLRIYGVSGTVHVLGVFKYSVSCSVLSNSLRPSGL